MVTLPKVPEGWVGVVEQARNMGIHPESLRRKMRYGELPEGSYQMVGRCLFFNPQEIPGVDSTDHDGP